MKVGSFMNWARSTACREVPGAVGDRMQAMEWAGSLVGLGGRAAVDRAQAAPYFGGGGGGGGGTLGSCRPIRPNMACALVALQHAACELQACRGRGLAALRAPARRRRRRAAGALAAGRATLRPPRGAPSPQTLTRAAGALNASTNRANATLRATMANPQYAHGSDCSRHSIVGERSAGLRRVARIRLVAPVQQLGYANPAAASIGPDHPCSALQNRTPGPCEAPRAVETARER